MIESRCVATDGACLTTTSAKNVSPRPSTTGTVALGHTECDVVRGIGAPDNVSLSNNPRGDRVAVVNYSRGQRAGIYTFTAGRLTSIERAPEAAAPARAPSRSGNRPRNCAVAIRSTASTYEIKKIRYSSSIRIFEAEPRYFAWGCFRYFGRATRCIALTGRFVELRTRFQPVFLGPPQRAFGAGARLAELRGLLGIALEQVRQAQARCRSWR